MVIIDFRIYRFYYFSDYFENLFLFFFLKFLERVLQDLKNTKF